MSPSMSALRQALRRLSRSPGFAALGVTTLALAFGAHIAIFSLVHALFLRPLPVAQPDTLVGIYQSRGGEGFYPLSLPDYQDYQAGTNTFEDLAAHYAGAPLSLRTEGGLTEINGSVVSPNYFPLLGIQPARGHFFEGREASSGQPVAVISHELWQERLGGREDALGSVVHLNGTAFTVVGVAPESFKGVRLGLPSEVWIPTGQAAVGYRWCDAAERHCTWLSLIGRLAEGRSLEQARGEMEALHRGIREASPLQEHPGRESGVSLAPLTGVHPAGRPNMERLALLLLLTVTLVVLVAGANLGGLLVARGLTRRQEIATRLALGASRVQVTSLFVLETLLLALAGGAGGLLVALGLSRIVALFYPSRMPLELGMDGTVVMYGLLLALVTGLLVGLVPGVQASRRSLVPALKEGGRPRLLGSLVVVQVALSFVLLTSTGLLVQSLGSFDKVGNLDPDTVATLRLRPRLVDYQAPQAQSFLNQVEERLVAVPGVESVAFATGLPPFPFFNPTPVHRPDEAPEAAEARPPAHRDEISPGLFATLGIPLLAGRDFDSRDRPESPSVAILNRSLARSLWPDRDDPAAVLGEALRVGDGSFQVVGVVQDAGYLNQTQESQPQFYTPYRQNPHNVDARLLVRTAGGGKAAALLPTLRREIAAIDGTVPVTETETLTRRLERNFASVYLVGRVLTVSGFLALFLSAVGLYGILAMAVAQRRREIGIRVALGGRRRHIVSLVFKDLLRLTGMALTLGLVASWAVTGRLAPYLYGVHPRDPTTFLAAVAALLLLTALAGWEPARRATRVDPAITLREG